MFYGIISKSFPFLVLGYSTFVSAKMYKKDLEKYLKDMEQQEDAEQFEKLHDEGYGHGIEDLKKLRSAEKKQRAERSYDMDSRKLKHARREVWTRHKLKYVLSGFGLFFLGYIIFLIVLTLFPKNIQLMMLYGRILKLILLLVAGYSIFASYKMYKKNLEKYLKDMEQKEDAEQFEKLYDECYRYGIEDLKDPGSAEKKQRAELIAKKYGYNIKDPTVLQRFDNMHKEKGQQRVMKEDQKKEKEKQKKEEEKRKEQVQYERLIHYAQFHGTDKPVAMFKDMMKEEGGGSISYIPMQKESDGMFMAGLASGIGGTIPALASLSRTAANNEVIRQQNEEIRAVNTAVMKMEMDRAASIARWNKAMQKTADILAVKLISDMPSAEVFQHLKFDNIQTEVSKLGAISVKAEASVEGKVTVFGKSGFIDGYVVAEIYNGSKKVGETMMVFPAYGSIKYSVIEERAFTYIKKELLAKKPVDLEGICLNCGEQGKKYTVKFVPGDLWIMEE